MCVWRGETEEEEEGWGKAEVSVVHYLLVLYTKLWRRQEVKGVWRNPDHQTSYLGCPVPVFWKSSSGACCCFLHSILAPPLPGQNEIWEGRGRGFAVAHTGENQGQRGQAQETLWCDNSPAHSITTATPPSTLPPRHKGRNQHMDRTTGAPAILRQDVLENIYSGNF